MAKMLTWSYAISDAIRFTLMMRKLDFFNLFFSKYLNASAAARQLGIHVRAPQIWVKHYYEDPESIFEIKQKTGQHCILGEEHKQFFLKLH